MTPLLAYAALLAASVAVIAFLAAVTPDLPAPGPRRCRIAGTLATIAAILLIATLF